MICIVSQVHWWLNLMLKSPIRKLLFIHLTDIFFEVVQQVLCWFGSPLRHSLCSLYLHDSKLVTLLGWFYYCCNPWLLSISESQFWVCGLWTFQHNSAPRQVRGTLSGVLCVGHWVRLLCSHGWPPYTQVAGLEGAYYFDHGWPANGAIGGSLSLSLSIILHHASKVVWPGRTFLCTGWLTDVLLLQERTSHLLK